MPSVAHDASTPTPPNIDHRRHRRVRLSCLGRCMFEDGRESVCQVVDMSLGGLAMIVPRVGRIGERVVAYIDHFGRLEGHLVRHIEGGFAMTLETSRQRREKFVEQLTWAANRDLLSSLADRRHERFVPRRPDTWLVLSDGERLRCRIVDVSPSGAAVQVDPRPAIGTLVILGRMRGRVVRHGEETIALAFADFHPPETIDRAFS